MARALQIAACALAFCALAAPVALADPPDVSVTLSGTLERTHEDTDNGSRAITFLSTANGPRAVTFAPDQPVPPNGAEVDLTGRLTDETLATDSVDVTGPTIAVPTTEGDGRAVLEADQGTPLASGAPRKVAIVVVTFSNGAGVAPAGTDAQLRGVLIGNPNSVSNYFSEQSFGAVSFVGSTNPAGDVYRVSIAADGTNCNGDSTHGPAWMTWGAQAAAAAGLGQTAYGYTNYDHVIYYFNSQGTCGWAGLGYMPGDEVYIDNAFSLSVVSHELGHNLGVHHASTLRCSSGGANIAFTSANRACSSDEYGDLYDIMGRSATNQQNAYHKLQSGWLGTSTGPRVTTITASGDYTVGPLEASSGVALLLIPHVTAGLDSSGRSSFGTTFALDYRQPTGSYFDAYAPPSLATGGVQIRLVQAPGSGWPIQTQLIDANPQTSTFADAALTPNSTFSDSTDGITIQTTDVNPLGATVHVTFGATGGDGSTGGGSPGGGTVAPPPDTSPPSSVANLSATVASGPVVTLAYAAATDDRAVGGYRITRDGGQIDNVAATQLTYADWTATYGSHSYGITPVDSSGNVGPTTSVVAVVAPPLPPVSTKPSTPGTDTGRTGKSLTTHATVKVTVKIEAKQGKRRVTLSWKKVAGAHRYAVTRNGRTFRSTSAARLVDTAPPRGPLRYVVVVSS